MTAEAAAVSSLLLELRARGRERVRIADLIEALDHRAFGAAMLLFALPNAVGIGTIPGVSTLFGVPQIVLAFQMILGFERPRLPAWLLERSIARKDFETFVDRGVPHLQRLERHLKPRLTALAEGRFERVLGLVFLVMATIVSLPIPFGNQPPAVAMALVALGQVARDGAFVAVGLVAGIFALAIALAVVAGGAAVIWLAIQHLFGG
ncbi:MAG: exopolysaccharide biosynthesis protein [Alphaproteobacteria bacterium]|nr:exopolysaccharide biosynthesis protein [Alphaproteobacteria bacterium]